MVVPAGGDKKVIPVQVWERVKWLSARNEYGFISRNDTKGDVHVPQTAIRKNNPQEVPSQPQRRRCCGRPWWSCSARQCHMRAHSHHRHCPCGGGPPRGHQKNRQNSESRGSMRDRRALLEPRPAARPRRKGPSHLATRRDPMGIGRSIPALLRREETEGADNRGAGERGNPARQSMCWGYGPWPAGVLHAQKG